MSFPFPCFFFALLFSPSFSPLRAPPLSVPDFGSLLREGEQEGEGKEEMPPTSNPVSQIPKMPPRCIALRNMRCKYCSSRKQQQLWFFFLFDFVTFFFLLLSHKGKRWEKKTWFPNGPPPLLTGQVGGGTHTKLCTHKKTTVFSFSRHSFSPQASFSITQNTHTTHLAGKKGATTEFFHAPPAPVPLPSCSQSAAERERGGGGREGTHVRLRRRPRRDWGGEEDWSQTRKEEEEGFKRLCALLLQPRKRRRRRKKKGGFVRAKRRRGRRRGGDGWEGGEIPCLYYTSGEGEGGKLICFFRFGKLGRGRGHDVFGEKKNRHGLWCTV